MSKIILEKSAKSLTRGTGAPTLRDRGWVQTGGSTAQPKTNQYEEPWPFKTCQEQTFYVTIFSTVYFS